MSLLKVLSARGADKLFGGERLQLDSRLYNFEAPRSRRRYIYVICLHGKRKEMIPQAKAG